MSCKDYIPAFIAYKAFIDKKVSLEKLASMNFQEGISIIGSLWPENFIIKDYHEE